MRPAIWFLAVFASVLAWSAMASAEEEEGLHVETREFGSWADTIAALQHELGSEGKLVHVEAIRRGHRLPCAEYDLDLDEAGKAAFAIQSCELSSDATPLLLVHRAALFDHGDFVPVPKQITIDAHVRVSRSERGGAESTGGAELDCSAIVHPFVVDMLTGKRVPLTPSRVDLRTLVAGVVVSPDGDGFRVEAKDEAVSSLDYTVVDRTTGRVLVSGNVSLHCATQVTTEHPPAAATAAPPVVALDDLFAAPGVPSDWVESWTGDWLGTAQCLKPIAQWGSRPWRNGGTCGTGPEFTIGGKRNDVKPHLAGYVALDLGAAGGSSPSGGRWTEFDGGITMGAALDANWYSLRAAYSMRYFSPRDSSQDVLGGCSGQGCGYAFMVVYGGLVTEAVLRVPLPGRWLVGIPIQLRFVPWVPGALELGGGLAVGRRF